MQFFLDLSKDFHLDKPSVARSSDTICRIVKIEEKNHKIKNYLKE